ncbi:MAG: MBL fold metallo-hydrolase [Pyrinomonadaceae bacterium]
MNLIVLGSGTSVPHPHRAAAGYWLNSQTGTVLLDISADAPHRMAQEQLDWSNLDAIWISHLHLDHIGGLAPFLFATRSSRQTQQRRKPLNIYGPAGFTKILTAVDQAYDYRLLKQPFPIESHEVAPGNAFEILPGLSAETFSTPHTKESLAIRLKDKSGATLAYTSDTGYSDDLIKFARGAKLLLMECSFYKNKPVKTHLEIKEAMHVAQIAQPRTVVLSHLYSEWDGINIAAEAKKFWSGETIEAFDGLRLEF